MNGLALRISQGGAKKTKKAIGFAALDVSTFVPPNLVQENKLVETFVKATDTDEQLSVLKKILEDVQEDGDIIKFLVVVFFHAEAKHPVKCFLARYITKTNHLQPPFSTHLSTEIESATHHKQEYKRYIAVVTKLACCVENFSAGVVAVQAIEELLIMYLTECLRCCVSTLSSTTTLSPTEKNEIFNLAHLALRLILHIMQKSNQPSKLHPTFKDIRQSIDALLHDDDVPMDTKSVCGILYLNTHLLENGPNYWTYILSEKHKKKHIKKLLSNAAAELALYSAIATLVSMDTLQNQTIDDENAAALLCAKILAIGEQNPSEPTFMLGVTRTLQHISKSLCTLINKDIGLILMEMLQSFVWAHLEYYMDSVRHLTSQILGNIVRYCAKLKREDDPKPLDHLFKKLNTLDKDSKSYYVGMTSLVSEVGAEPTMEMMPRVVDNVIKVLDVQAVQASATTLLETLLQKHSSQPAATLYERWVQPILGHVTSRQLDSSVLSILEDLLARVVKMDQDVMTHIGPCLSQPPASPQDLKCILTVARVARKAGVRETDKWGGVRDTLLKAAAVDACDETRILSLSLIVESPKSTEVFTHAELNFVLYYLKYNINAQAPNFRQLTLSLMKKFIKRLQDSYKAHKKQSSEDYYITFLEQLRAVCFHNLIPGANYSRRFVALQVLDWCETLAFDGYCKIWKAEYVETLLRHLEDSYENNKAFALHILQRCPTDIIQNNKYTISLSLDDIVKQASALKPTECVSAAYKLELLITKLPDNILQGNIDDSTPELVHYIVIRHLQSSVEQQLRLCEGNVVRECATAPMYGLLHCMRRVISLLDVHAISSSTSWRELISEMIRLCMRINACVACIVNNESPEGHLPMDMATGGDYLQDNSQVVRLEDGRQVTAQMVLLCAWRSVKEVSLLLGEIASRLTITGENQPIREQNLQKTGTENNQPIESQEKQDSPPIGSQNETNDQPIASLECSNQPIGSENNQPIGTLNAQQLLLVGEHFTQLLAETKHRGAFEQAYVGFTKLLGRLWRCRSASLHGLPRSWLQQLMGLIEGGVGGAGDKKGALCATRRSAGLPFMIQALVTTELQVQGNPKCFHECMTTLLRLARTPPEATRQTETAIETRTHAINILRALFRNSMLEQNVAGYVQDGLLVALEGFEGGTWMERNSSTLLLSALVVRVFGVTRSRSDHLCARNKMTGRIFFLRYPKLYDYMLEKLKEMSNSEDKQTLRPSLYPILMLLARLYPSSLEGTVSNLKLTAFIPYVQSCGYSAVLQTRQLAAKAIVPLISPQCYLSHLEQIMEPLCDSDSGCKVNRNECHGILLQLTKLLESKPELPTEDQKQAYERHLENFSKLNVGREIIDSLLKASQKQIYDGCIEKLLLMEWLLDQACGCCNFTGVVPCYLLADEYLKVINLALWKLPISIIDYEAFENIEIHLLKLIFVNEPHTTEIKSGKDVCLSNALYLVIIMQYVFNRTSSVPRFIHKSLTHKSYEVILAALNYILILNDNLEPEGMFQEHLSLVAGRQEQRIKKALKAAVFNSERVVFNPERVDFLCNVLKNCQYLECKQKCLKILNLGKNTEKYVANPNDWWCVDNEIIDQYMIRSLIYCVEHEHENLTHIYLETLSKFVTRKMPFLSQDGVLKVVRMMYESSRSDNSLETRTVAVQFLEHNLDALLNLDWDELTPEEQFEFKSTLFASLVTTLEDDDPTIRQRVADTIVKYAIGKRPSQTTTQTHTDTNVAGTNDISIESIVARFLNINKGNDNTSEMSEKTDQDTVLSSTHDVSTKENSKSVIDDVTGIDDVTESTSHNDIKQNENTSATDGEQDKNVSSSTCETNMKGNESTSTSIDSTSIDEREFVWAKDSDDSESKDICTSIIASRAAEVLRGLIKDDRVMVALALLHFGSEVCANDSDHLDDECRVFDQNERYNIFLEETVWTREFAEQIKQKHTNEDVLQHIVNIVQDPVYRGTFQKLCGNHLDVFEKMCNNQSIDGKDLINPKIQLFVNCLRG